MNPSARYRVAFPPYAHQEIEGEIVIVDVETGVYLSLRDSGASIFTHLAAGSTVAATIEALSQRYVATNGVIADGVAALVADLCKEGILEPDDGLPAAVAVSVLSGPPTPFEQPLLERFTDMKDLLLLDPIHDAGDAGWPIVKTPGA